MLPHLYHSKYEFDMLQKLFKPQFVHLICQTDFNNYFLPTPNHSCRLNLLLRKTQTLDQIGTMLAADICTYRSATIIIQTISANRHGCCRHLRKCKYTLSSVIFLN